MTHHYVGLWITWNTVIEGKKKPPVKEAEAPARGMTGRGIRVRELREEGVARGGQFDGDTGGDNQRNDNGECEHGLSPVDVALS